MLKTPAIVLVFTSVEQKTARLTHLLEDIISSFSYVSQEASVAEQSCAGLLFADNIMC